MESNNLTKEGFWNKMQQKYPLTMKEFCEWIDQYKKIVGWEKLFALKPFFKSKEDAFPKFHELPDAMQVGIFQQYLAKVETEKWDDSISSFLSMRETQLQLSSAETKKEKHVEVKRESPGAGLQFFIASKEDIARYPHLNTGSSYRNETYECVVCSVDKYCHLKIHRIDDEPIHNFLDIQIIKNELLGSDTVAIEIYPASADFKDGSNTYHLWTWRGIEMPNLALMPKYS